MTQDAFTAASLASALHRSKRSVLESLKGIPSSGTKIVYGNATRAWSKETIPQNILSALEDIASQRKTTVDALLSSPPARWFPPRPLSQLSKESIERASLLQLSLASVLARLDDTDLTAAELERLGVEDYRRAFGHGISTRHWRRLFRRTLERDGGAENWNAWKSISMNHRRADRNSESARHSFLPRCGRCRN